MDVWCICIMYKQEQYNTGAHAVNSHLCMVCTFIEKYVRVFHTNQVIRAISILSGDEAYIDS